MNNLKILLSFLSLLFIVSCNQKVKDATVSKTENAAKEIVVASTGVAESDLTTVPNDPLKVQIHTLANGMKIYMSVNKKEPRIQTNIAVRTGSKQDPADATGLAHYLEHMLFKGTDKMGSLDWEKEKVMLEKISDLYEQHRNTKDETERKEIYAEIDKVSNEAAKLVAANEYDKMVSSLGAKGTNAYTWVEQTVYVNDIPSNELERWMQLESERFKMVVLRLFHTELEAVYEEFNISQDNDGRKSNAALREMLFPTHPYGTQSTIGTGQHLKNPSHEKIIAYFKKHYIPNNMALVLAGDFEPAKVIAMAEKYFGDYKTQEKPKFTYTPCPPRTKITKREVVGKEAPFLDLAWRFDGADSDDPIKLMMLKGILSNGQAGLMDINISQQQKALEADAWLWPYEDYTVFGLYGQPRKGQSLEELKELLLNELSKIKNGEFDEWLMPAVIKDYKLSEIRSNENNRSRAGAMTNAFIKNIEWDRYVRRFDIMKNLTKSDIVTFANEHLVDNYAIIYKREGEDKDAVKVEKPNITPVSLNREQSSEYTQNFMSKSAPSMSPVFIDFKKEIQSTTLNGGLVLDYIPNKNNETFSLDYILEMGKLSDPLLPIAFNYLPYLGTEKYSAEDLQKEFFRLGLTFDVYSGDEKVYVTLSGLDESFAEGVELFEHILANVKVDEKAFENVIQDIIVKRENAKKDKYTILRQAMSSFAKYGPVSSFTDRVSEKSLRSLSPATLIKKIKSLSKFEHRIFYYGSQNLESVKSVLSKLHKTPLEFTPIKAAKKYPELDQEKDEVYFVHFPMVQAEIMMLSKGTPNWNKDEYIMSDLYNTYFGYGLSSIVFQEIRESKALAYSSYAYYSSPSKKDNAHYLNAYVGTQVDKLPQAIPAIKEIIENMPISKEQIETARQSILKKLEADRIANESSYWTYHKNKKLGIEHDIRKDVYESMQKITVEDLITFQEKNVKNRKYTYLILGDRDKVDLKFLNSIGPVKELQLEDIFGY